MRANEQSKMQMLGGEESEEERWSKQQQNRSGRTVGDEAEEKKTIRGESGGSGRGCTRVVSPSDPAISGAAPTNREGDRADEQQHGRLRSNLGTEGKTRILEQWQKDAASSLRG